MTADSMLMMLVEEEPIYECIYTHYQRSGIKTVANIGL